LASNGPADPQDKRYILHGHIDWTCVMIVGQRPGASPRLLIVILVVLAAAWVVREATHHGSPAARTPGVGAGVAQPASISLERPAEPQAPRR
jgi:hypothetical protein